MAKLTAKGRKRVKPSNFAVPKGKGKNKAKNSYPIHDAKHARNALARVAQHGTPAEKKAVRRKVKAKYPSIGRTTKRSGAKRKRGKS